MQWISDEMRKFWRDNIIGDPYTSKQPRDLTAEDRLGWDRALDKQPRGQQNTIESVRKLIRQRNPIKWHQIQGDVKYLRKEMKRLGLNPEDWKSLL